MAKNTKTSKAVAMKSGGSVMTSLKARIRQDAGKGVSTDQSDNLIPLVYILQAQSPQALKKDPAYINGAEAGSIWLRGASDPIVDGEEGFLFQPCYFAKCWIEWKPNREGFVARHAERPSDAKQVKEKDEKGNERLVWKSKAGNLLVESREHVGLVLGRGAPMGYVIPFSGSGHTVSRGWMTLMNGKVEDDTKLPSWCYIYRLKTRFRSNDKGSWYLFEVLEERPIDTEEEYMRGKALHDAFASGAKQTGEYDAVDNEAETEEV